MAKKEAIITPDQRARGRGPKASKQSSQEAKVPERLYRFDVAPPPVASTSSPTASAPSPPLAEPQQQSDTASAWPFPLVLPGSLSSTGLAPPVTTHQPQGLGYEYGPEVYIDRADYWEDARPSNPSFTPKSLGDRKDSGKKSKKKSKKSKLCPTNGYQHPQAEAGERRVQVKYSSQRKQWTTNTKEYLPEGGVRRIQIIYHMTVEVEEEHPVDSDGNIVTDADKDTSLNVRPRLGETNIDMSSSSDDSSDSSESSESSESSDSSDSDDLKEKRKKKSASGKGKEHKAGGHKHPGHAALHKKEKAESSGESSSTKQKKNERT